MLKKVYFGNQDIISNKIKKPSEYLLANIDKVDVKQHKIKKFLELEKIFYEWFVQYKEYMYMPRELIEEGKWVSKKMYSIDT